MTENAGTKKWRAMSIRIGPRAFPVSLTGPVQPHVAEWIRVNAEYVSAGAGKDRDRDLCEGGVMNGRPCRYLARPNRTSCGRKHDRE
jgi:hypothetical protein